MLQKPHEIIGLSSEAQTRALFGVLWFLINPDGNWADQYFALRLTLIYIGIDVVMNEETYFPRLSDFNFDFISENVGLMRGSLSQHICIKRMMPLLPVMSVGYSGLN